MTDSFPGGSARIRRAEVLAPGENRGVVLPVAADAVPQSRPSAHHSADPSNSRKFYSLRPAE